jgi:hypothetical protein
MAMVAALIWCGLTRRMRSSAIPLLILAGTALTPTEVGAASITYNVLNYPTLQNGYTVTGTITTDGSTGMELPGTDITSWDIVISKGTTTIGTLNPSDTFNETTTFDATPMSLSVGSLTDWVQFSDDSTNFIEWLNNPPPPGSFFAGFLNSTVIWTNSLPTLDSPIATVPEPSSAVLASIGAVVAFLAYGWSRHRREQHRLEAD